MESRGWREGWGGDGESGGSGPKLVNANDATGHPHSPPAVEGKGGFKLFFPFV